MVEKMLMMMLEDWGIRTSASKIWRTTLCYCRFGGIYDGLLFVYVAYFHFVVGIV
jgi:hypothetical protein